MSKGILVFVEQRDGKIRKASLEALSEGARLAAASDRTLTAALVGHGINDQAAGLGDYGAATTYVVDAEAYALYSVEGYTAAVLACIEQAGPDIVLMAGTAMGRDLAPRLGARGGWGVGSDAVETHLNDGQLSIVRPCYSGKARATIEFRNSDVVIATLRPNVFPIAKTDGSAEVTAVTDPAPTIRARVREITREEGGKLDVAEAEMIVSGGRGIKGPENWPVIEDLCDAIGAALGASRAVVDADWIDHSHQVGQTGKVVSPNLYVACGISGAIQHLAGMSSSKFIVAINKDAEAPIFGVADYGVVGDLFEVVPALAKEIRALKAE